MNRKKKVEAMKKSMLNYSIDSKNISGIHNYCDKWCERCAFTSRCAVYDMELQSKAENRNSDQFNESFWDELSVMFEAMVEILKEKSEEMGIDLSDMDTYEKPEHIETEVERVTYKYGMDLHVWLKENSAHIRDKALVLLSVSEEAVLSLNDALEVLDWYCFFINVKTRRAFSGLDKEQADFMIEEVNRTAKIAMIAVTRSMEAFSYLYSQLPEKEDDILNFLASLSQIMRLLNAAFPDAMSFKRPGFDD